MNRNWTRSQQRRYREERQRQAASVADRLLGVKRPFNPSSNDDLVDAMNYKFATNLYVPSPRSSFQITGFTV